MGESAYLYVTLNIHAVSGCIHPEGICGHGRKSLHERGATVEEVVSKLEKSWTAYDAEHARQRTEELAVKIIELTARNGKCTDAALRQEGFSKRDLQRYTEAACTRANAMAALGPFTVESAGKSNGAPDEDEA